MSIFWVFAAIFVISRIVRAINNSGTAGTAPTPEQAARRDELLSEIQHRLGTAGIDGDAMANASGIGTEDDGGAAHGAPLDERGLRPIEVVHQRRATIEAQQQATRPAPPTAPGAQPSMLVPPTTPPREQHPPPYTPPSAHVSSHPAPYSPPAMHVPRTVAASAAPAIPTTLGQLLAGALKGLNDLAATTTTTTTTVEPPPPYARPAPMPVTAPRAVPPEAAVAPPRASGAATAAQPARTEAVTSAAPATAVAATSSASGQLAMQQLHDGSVIPEPAVAAAAPSREIEAAAPAEPAAPAEAATPAVAATSAA